MEIIPFKDKVWLSSPTMHEDEQKWVQDAIRTNWVSTVGANIDATEELIAAYVGCKYAVGLSCGTAALHLATKLAGENCMDRRSQMQERYRDERSSAVTLHLMQALIQSPMKMEKLYS